MATRRQQFAVPGLAVWLVLGLVGASVPPPAIAQSCSSIVQITGQVTAVLGAQTVRVGVGVTHRIRVGDTGFAWYAHSDRGAPVILVARVKVIDVQDLSSLAVVTDQTQPVQVGHRVTVAVPGDGELNIESDPPGATISLGSDHAGETPRRLPRVRCGRHEIHLALKGYLSYALAIDVKFREVLRIRIPLEPDQPCTGTLRAQTLPPGGQVTVVVAGSAVTRGLPAEFTGLPCGEHRVRFAHPPAFEDVDRHVQVERGVTTELTMSLPPVRGGTLSVISDPAGAAVFLDGALLGVTPVSHVSITPGRHHLRVERPPLMPLEEALTVASRQAVARHFDWCWGSLGVRTQPAGANVVIEAPGGQLRAQSPATFSVLPCGELPIRIEKADPVASHTASVHIVRREERTLDVVLIPLPSSTPLALAAPSTLKFNAAGDGFVRFTSCLFTATIQCLEFAVEVGGEIPLGWGPGSLDDQLEVAPGRHRIRLLFRDRYIAGQVTSSRRYVLYEKDVSVAAGQRLDVRFDLHSREATVGNGAAEPIRQPGDRTVPLP